MFHTTCTAGEGTPVIKQYYVVKQQISMQDDVYSMYVNFDIKYVGI